MIDKDKIDDIYKNQFEEFELPVSDKLLANIKQDLGIAKRKRRFRYWHWITFSALLLTGVAAAYYLYIHSTNTIQQAKSVDATSINTNTFTDKNVKNELNAIEKTKTDIVPSTSNALDNEEQAALTNNAAQQIENTSQTEKNSSNKKDIIQTTNNSKKDERNIKTNEIAKSASEKAVSNKSDTQALSTDKTSVKQNKKSAVDSNKQNTSAEKEEKSGNTTVSKIEANETTDTNKKNASGISDSTVLSKQLVANNNAATPVKDSLALKTEADTLKTVAGDSSIEKPMKKNDSKSIKNDPSKICFFVELNGGPSFSYRKLSGSNAAVQSRNENEKQLITYTAGIDLGAIVKNKFSISSGIRMDTKGEKYTFAGQQEKFETVMTPIYDSLNNIIGMDTNTVQLQATLTKNTTSNTYQFLNIPIVFGYKFSIKEKWFISPSIGISINYLVAAKSSWVDPTTHQYVYYNKSDNKFSNISIAGRIKMDIGMNMNDKWSVLIQPAYTRFLQSIHKENETLKLQPYSYDINLGLRYTF